MYTRYKWYLCLKTDHFELEIQDKKALVYPWFACVSILYGWNTQKNHLYCFTLVLLKYRSSYYNTDYIQINETSMSLYVWDTHVAIETSYLESVEVCDKNKDISITILLQSNSLDLIISFSFLYHFA